MTPSNAVRRDTLLAFGNNGRVYTVAVASLPGARCDGQPFTTLIELESGMQLLYYFAGASSAQLLLQASGGYGFIASVEHMIFRQKAGKAFISVAEGETACKPSPIEIFIQNQASYTIEYTQAAMKYVIYTRVTCATTGGCTLTFELAELKTMTGGRRSLNKARAARARKGIAADMGFKPTSVIRVE